jgi:16S rRNA (guanine(966)-N(2))-methyltransferase RsmD
MLRIIAGRLGGRRIAAPKGSATRPTAEKVRQAVFNVLAHAMPLEGALVLDLYAGSGALGIEALSRGAAQATLVEADARTAAVIRANLSALALAPEEARVVVAPVLRWLKTASAQPPFDLVLADPPYDAGQYGPLLAALADWPGIAPGGYVVVEVPARLSLSPPAGLELAQTKRYGDTQVLFLRKPGAPPQAQPEPES